MKTKFLKRLITLITITTIAVPSTANAASRDSFIQSCYGYTGRRITHLPEKAPTFGATEPMVVLSTCILKEENNRFLVLCKMTGVVNK